MNSSQTTKKQQAPPGTWQAKRSYDERWSWDVTYSHPGIGVLWLGVGHTWTGVFTDETAASKAQWMLTGQRIE